MSGDILPVVATGGMGCCWQQAAGGQGGSSSPCDAQDGPQPGVARPQMSWVLWPHSPARN